MVLPGWLFCDICYGVPCLSWPVKLFFRKILHVLHVPSIFEPFPTAAVWCLDLSFHTEDDWGARTRLLRKVRTFTDAQEGKTIHLRAGGCKLLNRNDPCKFFLYFSQKRYKIFARFPADKTTDKDKNGPSYHFIFFIMIHIARILQGVRKLTTSAGDRHRVSSVHRPTEREGGGFSV